MAGITPATTTVHVDARRPFAALELPDKEKFTGKNHPAFVRNLRIILRYLKVLYLIDDEAQKKPANAVEEDDKELLYMCLHRNLEENGKDLIAEHGGDGVKAWKAFNKRFGQADTGTTMDKFWEHISTRWEGGDSESFIDFVAKWDSTRRELRNRDIKLEDWIDALLLMAMVPREFTSKLKDSELQDWKELKRENVIDRIQAYISAQGKEGGAAFTASMQDLQGSLEATRRKMQSRRREMFQQRTFRCRYGRGRKSLPCGRLGICTPRTHPDRPLDLRYWMHYLYDFQA